MSESDFSNPEFIALKDEEIKSLIEWLEGMGYDNSFDAIKITNVEVVDGAGKKMDIKNENLRDTVHVSIFHKYVNTPVNMTASNLKEAIHREDYIKNECWINALLDFYGGSLMNEKAVPPVYSALLCLVIWAITLAPSSFNILCSRRHGRIAKC